MKINNPIRGLGGAARENSFVVTDDAGVQIGRGSLEYRLLGKMLPDRPLDIELHMEAHPMARDTLLGALTARAERIRQANRGVPARLYTRCAMDDHEMYAYFMGMGYDDFDGDELFVLNVPELRSVRKAYPPVGTESVDARLKTRADREKFLIDCKNFGCLEHHPEWLEARMREPIFLAREVYSGKSFAGLMLMTGNEQEAVLDIVGVEEKWRRRGVAGALFYEALTMLNQYHVPYLIARSVRRNKDAMRFFQRSGFEWVRTEGILLGCNLD